MARKLKPANSLDEGRIAIAVERLKTARDLLKAAGCSDRCVERVRSALASAKGAQRHVIGRRLRTEV